MAVNRADKSFEILIDEENLDEVPAVDCSTQDKPWSRNRGRNPQPLGIPGLPVIRFASQQEKYSERKSREKDGNRPFRQNTQTERRIKPIEVDSAPGSRFIEPCKKKHQRHRKTCRERHIHGGSTRERERTDRCDEDQSGKKTGRTVPESPAAPIDEEDANGRSKRRCKSCSGFIHAEYFV